MVFLLMRSLRPCAPGLCTEIVALTQESIRQPMDNRLTQIVPWTHLISTDVLFFPLGFKPHIQSDFGSLHFRRIHCRPGRWDRR